MTWKEGQPKPSGAGAGAGGEEWEVIKEDEVREAREEASTSTVGTQGQEGESRSSIDLKRKTLERNESSILQPEEPVKKAKEIPSVRSCPSLFSITLTFAAFPSTNSLLSPVAV
jgi:hypothetical protein